MTTDQLFQIAETHNIYIDDTFPLDSIKAASCDLENGCCVIGLHRALKDAAYREHLAHEIGHCITGAFYNPRTPVFTRMQCENRAYRWQMKKLMPWRSLEKAVRLGYTEAWQLAEYFDVSEDFVRKAVEIYAQEGKTIVF